jgi:hypothetical protein
MTTQNDINKDMVSLVGSLSDGINQLRKAVELLAHDLSSTISEINDLKSSQNIRNENFNDRLINLEENKIKVIDEELKRIDTLEQAFNREL